MPRIRRVAKLKQEQKHEANLIESEPRFTWNSLPDIHHAIPVEKSIYIPSIQEYRSGHTVQESVARIFAKIIITLADDHALFPHDIVGSTGYIYALSNTLATRYQIYSWSFPPEPVIFSYVYVPNTAVINISARHINADSYNHPCTANIEVLATFGHDQDSAIIRNSFIGMS